MGHIILKLTLSARFISSDVSRSAPSDIFYFLIRIAIIICLLHSRRAKQTFIVDKNGIPTSFPAHIISTESDALEAIPESKPEPTPPPIAPREDKPIPPPPVVRPQKRYWIWSIGVATLMAIFISLYILIFHSISPYRNGSVNKEQPAFTHTLIYDKPIWEGDYGFWSIKSDSHNEFLLYTLTTDQDDNNRCMLGLLFDLSDCKRKFLKIRDKSHNFLPKESDSANNGYLFIDSHKLHINYMASYNAIDNEIELVWFTRESINQLTYLMLHAKEITFSLPQEKAIFKFDLIGFEDAFKRYLDDSVNRYLE